jgi:diguanylate cyclase (GGDEF)-like protein/PAS domain S-box-containing protein
MVSIEQYKVASVLENLHNGVYFVDKNRKILFWNKSAETITGFSSDEVVNTHCHNNILNHVDYQGNPLCTDGCPLSSTIEDGKNKTVNVFLKHKDGHRLPITVTSIPLLNNEGERVGAVEVFSDQTYQKELEVQVEDLKNLALLDNLTQLPNRHFCNQELNAQMEEFTRYGHTFGVIFMDIDHFKNFNDKYGHDVGDLVLKVVSKTLKNSIRPFDMVGRWGGEEFVCLLKNITTESLEVVANRFISMVRQSQIPYENDMLGVTISLGATVVTKGDTIDSIVKRADHLMYDSKQNGRNRYTLG